MASATISLWGRRIETTTIKARLYHFGIVPLILALGVHATYQVVNVVAGLLHVHFVVSMLLLCIVLVPIDKREGGVKVGERALLSPKMRGAAGYALMLLTLLTLAHHGQLATFSLVNLSLMVALFGRLMRSIWSESPPAATSKTVQRLRKMGRDVADVEYQEIRN